MGRGCDAARRCPMHSRALLGLRGQSCLPSGAPTALPRTIRQFSSLIQQKTSSCWFFFFPPFCFVYFRLINVIFCSFLQAVCRVRKRQTREFCTRKSREARKGVVRQALAGSSELLNLLKCPNKCVSSWKDELVLCFCHPACIPHPFFELFSEGD